MTTSHFFLKETIPLLILFYFLMTFCHPHKFLLYFHQLSNYLHINHARRRSVEKVVFVFARVNFFQNSYSFTFSNFLVVTITILTRSFSLFPLFSFSVFNVYISRQKANKSSSSMNCGDIAVEMMIKINNTCITTVHTHYKTTIDLLLLAYLTTE